MNKQFLWGFGIAIVGFAIAWLLGIANSQEDCQKQSLAEYHAVELKSCLEATEGTDQTCRIEYLKDRTDTIYGAKVVREAK